VGVADGDGSYSITVNSAEAVDLFFGGAPVAYTAVTPTSASVTITDLDVVAVPVMSIAVEGLASLNEAGAPAFRVTANPRPASGVTVAVNVQITGTGDFFSETLPTTRTVLVSGGGRSLGLADILLDDLVDEPDGSLTATIQTGTGYDPADAPANAATITVTDNDVAPRLRLVGPTAAADEDGGDTLEFTVRIERGNGELLGSGYTVTVDYATSDGAATGTAATAGTDYTAATGTLTFIPGENEKAITVSILDDAETEATAEVFTLTLTDPVRATPIGNQFATGTIAANTETIVTPFVANASADEGGTLNFLITRDDATGELRLAYELEYGSGDGFAQAADIIPAHRAERTVTIPGGESTLTLSVTTLIDAAAEPNETFTLVVSNSVSMAELGRGTGTINANAAVPELTIAAGTSPITEGTSAEFTITASVPAAEEIVINLTSNEVGDYLDSAAPPPTTITLAMGADSITFSVTTVNDTEEEINGSLAMTLATGSGYLLGDTISAVVVIENDDLPFITANVSADEGDSLRFIINRGDRMGELALGYFQEYGSGDGSAQAEDFITVHRYGNYASGTFANLILPAAEANATLTLTTLVDRATEDAETFELVVINAADGSEEGRATGTINANIAALIDDTSADEGDALEFIVYRPTGFTDVIELSYTLAYGSGNGFAGAEDIIPAHRFADPGNIGTLTLQTSELTATITVTTAIDIEAEPDETFTLIAMDQRANLGLPMNMASATGTINANDAAIMPAITIAADASPVTEADNAIATFTITADPAPSINDLAINITITETGDYIAGTAPDGVTLATTESTATLTVNINNDTTDEDDADITATVQTGTGYTFTAPAAATVRVEDDDAAPTLAVTPQAATEGREDLGFIALIAPPSGKTVTVDYATFMTDSDTATSGSDYEPTMGTLTFIPGNAVLNIAITVIDDTDSERDESMTLRFSNAVNINTDPATTAFDADGNLDAIGTIRDNDRDPNNPTLFIAAGAATIEEGNPALFVITADVGPGRATGFNVTVAETGTGNHLTTNPLTRRVLLEASESSITLTVNTIDTPLDEYDGTITATIETGAGYRLGDPSSASLTITSVGDTPTVSIADTTVNEGTDEGGALPPDRIRSFPVILSAASGKTITIDYDASEGTATEARNQDRSSDTIGGRGGDYYREWRPRGREPNYFDSPQTYFPGTLTFAPGQTAQTIGIEMARDFDDEPDEQFTLHLSDLVNVLEAGSDLVATITIRDAGALRLSLAPVGGSLNVNEGDPIRVRLVGEGRNFTELGRAVTLSAVQVGSFGVPATNITFTLPEGEVNGTVPIGTGQPENDIDDEENIYGTVVVTLEPTPFTGSDFTKQGYNIGSPSSITLTVVDDDPPPLLTVREIIATATEGTDVALVYSVSLTGSKSDRTVTLDYATSDFPISATAAVTLTDYEATAGSLTFAPGDTSARTITVPIVDDAFVENNETFNLRFSNLMNARFPGNATEADYIATIVSEDVVTPPILSLATNALYVVEGNTRTELPYQIIADRAPGVALSVNVEYGTTWEDGFDGVCGLPSQPRTIGAQVAFAADGSTSADADFPSLCGNSRSREPAGIATIVLLPGDGYVVGEPRRLEVAVLDNGLPDVITENPAPPATYLFSAGAEEGEPLVFTALVFPLPFLETNTGTGESETWIQHGFRVVTGNGGGTATGGGVDYRPSTVTSPNLQLTIDPASAVARFTVNTVDDDVDEVNETVVVRVETCIFPNPSARPIGTCSGINPGPGIETVTITSPVTRRVPVATASIFDNDGEDSAVTTVLRLVAATDATEGDPLTFTITANPPPAVQLPVTISLSETGDFLTRAHSSLLYPAGQTSAIFSIATEDDGDTEADSTVTMTLVDGLGYVVDMSQDTQTATASDNDAPILSIVSADHLVREGATASFTVTSNRTTTVTLNVSFDISLVQSDGSLFMENTFLRELPPGDSWDLTSEIVQMDNTDVVAGGHTPYNISFQTTAAAYDVNPELAGFNLLVQDDDGPPSLSIGDAQAYERDARLVFPLLLTRETMPPGEVVITYDIMPGLLTAGLDYPADLQLTGLSLTIPEGQLSASITVTLLDDAINENDETLEVVITATTPPNPELTTGRDTATGTIIDDDRALPLITITASSSSITEGDSVGFSVSSDRSLVSELTVRVSLSGADNYLAPSTSSLTLPAGNETVSFSITTTDNDDNDAAAHLTAAVEFVPADNYRAHPITGSARVQIRDNDDPAADAPLLTLADPTALEIDGTIDFVVSLATAATATVTLSYQTQPAQLGSPPDTTAILGDDYEATAGTLTLAVGATAVTATVTLIDDNISEFTEQFTLEFFSPVNARFNTARETASATGSITDNDAPGLYITADAATVVEGQPVNMTLHATRSLPTPLTVSYNELVTRLVDGRQQDTLNGGGQSLPRTVEFPAGTSSHTFLALLPPDNLVTNDSVTNVRITLLEDPDDFYTLLTAATTPTVAETSVTDNDAGLYLGLAPFNLTEPRLTVTEPAGTTDRDTGQSFSVTLNAGATVASFVLHYSSLSTGSDTATSGVDAQLPPSDADYGAIAGTMTFALGQTRPSLDGDGINFGQFAPGVTVPIYGDDLIEEDETFTLLFETVDGSTRVSVAAFTITIIDEDRPTVTLLAGGTVTEGERSVTEVRVDPQLSGEDSFVVSVLIDDGENDFIA
ncbi:MAG: Calx-beta domain-containing protein, partial [Pseudohongiellaceae bacterium]